MTTNPPAEPGMLWLNGELMPVAEARISPLDHAVTVGDGVFETMKVVGGTAFALTRHLRRLHRSADALGLDLPADAVLRSATEGVLAANPGATRVRLTVSSGTGPPGSGRGESTPTVLAFTGEAPLYEGTTTVATVEWTRNETGALAGVKSISYAENVLALRRAHAIGATEALCANTKGWLCEGTGSNIFVVLDGEFLTPPLSSGCLAGITRELTLEVTNAVERDIAMADLGRVSEAFLTSSTRDVQGIAAIDGVALPAAPGPVTLAAAEAFAEMATNLDP